MSYQLALAKPEGLPPSAEASVHISVKSSKPCKDMGSLEGAKIVSGRYPAVACSCILLRAYLPLELLLVGGVLR
jgi:hypothetical protein